jgi:hypothetical protein
LVHSPVLTSTRPVIAQTTTVSQNVPVDVLNSRILSSLREDGNEGVKKAQDASVAKKAADEAAAKKSADDAKKAQRASADRVHSWPARGA